MFCEERTYERKAIRMQSMGGKTEDQVSFGDLRSIDDFGTLYDADYICDKNVSTGLKNTRLFRGFSADEGTSLFLTSLRESIHNFYNHCLLQFSANDCILNVEREGTHDRNVIYQMIDGIEANRRDVSMPEGELLLGAGFFGFEHEDGIFVAIEFSLYEGCKGTDGIQDARISPIQALLKYFFRIICSMDIDAGIFVRWHRGIIPARLRRGDFYFFAFRYFLEY